MQGRPLELQEQWHAPQPLLDTGTVAAWCLHVVQMFAYLLCFVFHILYLVWFLILWFHHREHAPSLIFMASNSVGWIWSIKQDKGTGVPSEDDRTLYWNSYSCYSVPFLTNFLTGFDGYKSDWYSGSSSPSARTNWQEDWISKSQRRCK